MKYVYLGCSFIHTVMVVQLAAELWRKNHRPYGIWVIISLDRARIQSWMERRLGLHGRILSGL